MDDVTLTEVITKGSDLADSNMAHYISHQKQQHEVEFQEDEINDFGSVQKNPPASLSATWNKYFR